MFFNEVTPTEALNSRSKISRLDTSKKYFRQGQLCRVSDEKTGDVAVNELIHWQKLTATTTKQSKILLVSLPAKDSFFISFYLVVPAYLVVITNKTSVNDFRNEVL